ncbi:DUF1269 domain-containing protein [Variovorax sp. DAIF25]|uniref:DUF1269 domain-containing protein n=1 Tax=Variovorax sp. DAIF25 TaxID=3080983 RepID=UPI003D6B3AAB
MATNIILITWPDSSQAYRAFSAVKSSSHVNASQAAVLERSPDGRFSVKDGNSNTVGLGSFGGGLIGGLVGILGGPLGMLLGFSSGSLFGSVVDLGQLERTESVIAAMSQFIRPGTAALLLQVDEDSPAMIDTVAEELGGQVLRRSLEQVEAEVLAAEAAAVAAAREASRVLREESKAERKAERSADWENIKQKFKSVFS